MRLTKVKMVNKESGYGKIPLKFNINLLAYRSRHNNISLLVA